MQFAGKKLLLLSIIAAIDLVIATLFIPVVAETPSDLKTIEFGWPITFVSQELKLDHSENTFPRKLLFSGPWEHPTEIFAGRFMSSFFLIFLMILGAVSLSSLLLQAFRKQEEYQEN